MRLKSSFVCSICNLVLKNPVKLPCLDLICRKHVRDSAKNASIRCTKCEKDFTVPQQGFESNTVMATKLSKLLHLSIEEKRIKHTIEGVISQIEQLTENLNRMHSDLEQNSFAHFAEIRRKIEIQRKSLNAKIDEIALKMIEQVDEDEKAYNSKWKASISALTGVNIKKERKKLFHEFRKPNLLIEQAKLLQDEHEEKLNELQARIHEFANLKEELESLDFKSGLELKEASFGQLKPRQFVASTVQNTVKIWNLKDTNDCVATLCGHSQNINCLENIDANRFASGSTDSQIKIWDANEFACVKTLIGHSNSVSSLQSLSANRIASGSYCEIKIWDIESGQCVQTLNGHLKWITGLACLPNKHLASCSVDGIKIWDLDRGECKKTLTGHLGPVFCLLLLQNGQLASGSRDTTIKIWNLESNGCVNTLKGHSLAVMRLQTLASGDLVSCSLDGTIKVWDLSKFVCVKTLDGHTDWVTAIRMNTRKSSLLSCSADGTLKTWNLKTGERISSIDNPSHTKLFDLIFI